MVNKDEYTFYYRTRTQGTQNKKYKLDLRQSINLYSQCNFTSKQ